jgi:hypothetical protein
MTTKTHGKEKQKLKLHDIWIDQSIKEKTQPRMFIGYKSIKPIKNQSKEKLANIKKDQTTACVRTQT